MSGSPDSNHQFEDLLHAYEAACETLAGTENIQHQLDYSSNPELAKQVSAVYCLGFLCMDSWSAAAFSSRDTVIRVCLLGCVLQLVRDVPVTQRVVDAYVTKLKVHKAQSTEVSQAAKAELASKRAAADVLLSSLSLSVARAQDDNRADGSPNDHATVILGEAARFAAVTELFLALEVAC